MSTPLQGTESAALAIDRVKYSHDAMIDLVITQPGITQNKIAEVFGYTAPWVSRIFNSDAFLARLAERKKDLVDPTILMSLDEKLNTLANQSAEILMDKLATVKNPDTALKVLELTTKAMGYGARERNLSIQNNFVVAMPQKAATAEEWAAAAMGSGAAAGRPDLAALTPLAPAVMPPPGDVIDMEAVDVR